MTEPKLDFNSLVLAAKTSVIASQEATYTGIKAVIGGNNPAIVGRVLRALAKQGVVAQLENRRFVVLEQADGTKKEPPANARKKPRNLRRHKATKKKPRTTKAPAAKVAVPATQTFSDAEKIKKLIAVADALGESGKIFRAIADDLQAFASVRKLADALK